MAFNAITTGTYAVNPSANDVASTTGDGKYLKETLLTDLLDAITTGDFIVSGFDYASAASLVCTFNGGSAIIGGYWLTRTGTFTATVADEATNDVYLTFAVDGSNNVTGWGLEINATATAPTSVPGYVHIATIVTTGGSVSGAPTDQRTTAHPLEESDAANITSGVLKHERGGLELDVSAYSGILKISGGTTSQAVAGTDFDGPGANRAVGDGESINLGTPALGTDHTVSGVTASLVAGESLVFGDVCYMKSDGKLWKSDASAASTMQVLAMAGAIISADATGVFLLVGFARDDTWAWTVGDRIFASETGGALTATVPTTSAAVVQVCATATHADRVLFNPSNDVTVLA
jgi:hypothetical protein